VFVCRRFTKTQKNKQMTKICLKTKGVCKGGGWRWSLVLDDSVYCFIEYRATETTQRHKKYVMFRTKGGLFSYVVIRLECIAIVLVFLKHGIFQQVLIQEHFVDDVVCGVIFCLFRKGRLVKIKCIEFVDKGWNLSAKDTLVNVWFSTTAARYGTLVI